jgi:hypothetical protein
MKEDSSERAQLSDERIIEAGYMHTVETDEPLFQFDRKELIAMVRELLAADRATTPVSVAEPVAWMFDSEGGRCISSDYAWCKHTFDIAGIGSLIPLYATQPAADNAPQTTDMSWAAIPNRSSAEDYVPRVDVDDGAADNAPKATSAAAWMVFGKKSGEVVKITDRVDDMRLAIESGHAVRALGFIECAAPPANAQAPSAGVPEAIPEGPLKKLGARLAMLLDEDQFNGIEPLLEACILATHNTEAIALTFGMDRGQFHDRAWALYQAKALDDAKLPKRDNAALVLARSVLLMEIVTSLTS